VADLVEVALLAHPLLVESSQVEVYAYFHELEAVQEEEGEALSQRFVNLVGEAAQPVQSRVCLHEKHFACILIYNEI
jgi:DNA phosphorothioation-dependent restriction protein DptG